MWKVSKKLFAITTLPLVIVGIVFIYLAITADPTALTEDGFNLQQFYFFMAACFIVFPMIGSLGVYLFYKRINDRETNLVDHGLQGEAEILHREQTGTYLNEQPQVKFQLLITLPDREPYQIEHKDIVNMLDLSFINVGAKMPVFVDPNNEKNVLLVYS